MDATILTSLLDNGFYSDEPDFSKDIWPILEANLSKMEIRMVFRGRVGRIDRAYLAEHTQLAQKIWTIDPIKLCREKSSRRLSPGVLDWFESAVGEGHFAVLFKSQHKEQFLWRLRSAWPVKTIEPLDRYFPEADLKSCFNEICENEVVFSFGHDGDPMIVINGQPPSISN